MSEPAKKMDPTQALDAFYAEELADGEFLGRTPMVGILVNGKQMIGIVPTDGQDAVVIPEITVGADELGPFVVIQDNVYRENLFLGQSILDDSDEE